MTRSELLDRLAVLLGGRVAEEIKFHEISTGAQNDLERATDIAMSMVREYGMSEKMGPMTFQNGRRPQFMDLGLRTSRELSEEVSKDIDNEVKKLIFDTHARVKGILEENKDRLPSQNSFWKKRLSKAKNSGRLFLRQPLFQKRSLLLKKISRKRNRIRSSIVW